MTHVADTHSLVWYLNNDPHLSTPARDALADPTALVVIPSIVLAEIADLHSKGKISVDLPTVLAFIHAAPTWSVYALDEEVVKLLPSELEIHDGIIVATAIYRRDVLGETVTLITKDPKIIASGLVTVTW